VKISNQTAVTAVAFFMFALMVFIVFGDSGFQDLNEKRKTRTELARRNESLIRENLHLHRMIDRLETDLDFIECMARKDLGLMRENEIMFKLEDGSSKGKTP